jgi:hypothetical protein
MTRITITKGVFIEYEVVGGEETGDLHVKISIEADPDNLKENIFLVFHKIASIISKVRGGK